MSIATPAELEQQSPKTSLQSHLDFLQNQREIHLQSLREHQNLAQVSDSRAQQCADAIEQTKAAIGALELYARPAIIGIDPGDLTGAIITANKVSDCNLGDVRILATSARGYFTKAVETTVDNPAAFVQTVAQGITAQAPQEFEKITLADIEAQINSELTFTIGAAAQALNVPCSDEADRVTVCVITLKNGFTLVGVNEGPVHPSNFDAELGRKYARQQAIDKAWPLLGYALKDKLAKAQPAGAVNPSEPPPNQIKVGYVPLKPLAQ